MILLLIGLILSSLFTIALKEGETEFFEFNDEQFALTAANVNPDGTADIIISKHIPDFAKSLNVGESQTYFSNWQCFVATLFDVELDKSNVYISKCAGMSEESIEPEKTETKTATKTDIKTETKTATETTNSEKKTAELTIKDDKEAEEDNLTELEQLEQNLGPVQETPEPFLEKKISLGNVLMAVLVFFGLIMIILLFVVYYVRKGSY
ncbi:hypothetical protein HY636_00540 [Candidatus Woesearchaeota archaeon]|nr:hypothetical protein [Candidatus Woesearchaeota archaeon]